MRSLKRRAFLLFSAAASIVALAVVASPASAEKHTLLVTLLGGSQITVTVDVPPGTPVDQIKIPGVSLPVIGVQDLTPASSTPTTPTQTAPTTSTQTTPTHTQTQTTPTTPSHTKTTPTTPHHSTGGSHNGGSGSKHSGSGSNPKTNSNGSKKSSNKSKSKSQPKTKGPEKESLQKAAKKTHTLRDKGGAPTAANPTFSFAAPGPAAIGVPNFFIDRFRVPPFLLSIYQA
ncbi:MAG TPA: hypothetical protein VGI54_03955, partial [Solirubrobacteraceae bacterium]